MYEEHGAPGDAASGTAGSSPSVDATPDSPIAPYVAACLAMDDAERAAAVTRVRCAVEARESRLKAEAATLAKSSDYSQSFSGSAADTKAEKEFGKMLGGDEEEGRLQHAGSKDLDLDPVVSHGDSPHYDQLRQASGVA